MRPFPLVTLMPVLVITSLSAFASQPAAPGARAVGGLRETEFVAREVRPQTKTIGFDEPHGSGVVHVSSRTWIFKDNEEATFADLCDGQRLHVWYIPRGAKAVIVKVLPSNSKEGAQRREENASPRNWMTFYYMNPQPDRFVSEVRKRSKAGSLSTPKAEPPMVAFLSRVIADNPEKIAMWMAALADLPENDKETLHKAIWFSHTEAGKTYFQKQGLLKYLAEEAPDILKMPIESPAVLDMLWGYFLATGDEGSIRRIVSAFNYYPYAGALERYKTSPRTTDDAKQAHFDVILRASLWSLSDNCRRHPRVMQICREIEEDGDLNPIERDCLKAVLDKIISDSMRNTRPNS